MQSDLLNSQRWLSLVFEGRNKEYGAYVHRKESSDRHLIAMGIITIIALGLIFLPKVLKSALPEQKVSQVGPVTIAVFEDPKEVNKDPIKMDVPPPPKLAPSIMFTPPVITHDDNVKNEEVMKTQMELTESEATISIATVDGVKGGIDISEVTKIIEEAPKPATIHSYVEVMPQFPGGEIALMKWLQDNMTYPTIAAETGIQGRVVVRFVVTPDGSIDDVTVVKGLDPSCDKEAARVVKKMPKWTPGKQNGNPVYVYYSLPVVFRLQNN